MSQPAPLIIATLEGHTLVVHVLVEQVRDTSVAYRLRDEIVEQIKRLKPVSAVVDLSKTNFVGSVGFLAFLGVRRELPGGRIVLCNLSETIREMFAICKLIATDANQTAPFEVAPNQELALVKLAV